MYTRVGSLFNQIQPIQYVVFLATLILLVITYWTEKIGFYTAFWTGYFIIILVWVDRYFMSIRPQYVAWEFTKWITILILLKIISSNFH